MREILFRGKRTDNGQWVEGDLTRYSEVRSYITVDLIENEMYEVDAQTVGQYTGLCDKSGKRIYEGDVLDCGDRIVYVKWHEQCGIWDSQFVKYTNNSLCSNGVTAVEWKFRALVIGNVHDNPELLESPYES